MGAATSPDSDSVTDAPLTLDDPSLYLDRELSLLAFQRRVLDEARDLQNPLLERVKFLSILFSNVDEFFMVRVAVLRQNLDSAQPDGPVYERLGRIAADVRLLLADAYDVWRALELELVQAGIDVRDYRDLDERQRAALDTYFRQVVHPVLTPLALDPG